MTRILNAIVDLQSVAAVVLATALMVGAFQKVYQEDKLDETVASMESETVSGTAPSSCDLAQPDAPDACDFRRFDLDSLALGQVSAH